MDNYEGPFEGYYFSEYHHCYVNKRYNSLEEIINLGVPANITKHKSGVYSFRKKDKLLKSPESKNGNKEISWRYIGDMNLKERSNISFEKIKYKGKVYYLDTKNKLLLDENYNKVKEYPF